jgi:mycothiol synthase
VGTHRAFRRRGLGRGLLLHGLRELRRLGMESATVQHDAANLAARDLYRGLGFERRFETFGYRRAEASA